MPASLMDPLTLSHQAHVRAYPLQSEAHPALPARWALPWQHGALRGGCPLGTPPHQEVPVPRTPLRRTAPPSTNEAWTAAVQRSPRCTTTTTPIPSQSQSPQHQTRDSELKTSTQPVVTSGQSVRHINQSHTHVHQPTWAHAAARLVRTHSGCTGPPHRQGPPPTTPSQQLQHNDT
jgi:hypothetical protein